MSESQYILTSDGELYHYGILGMKWGVRRYQNKDGSLTAAGKKRIAKKAGEYLKPDVPTKDLIFSSRGRVTIDYNNRRKLETETAELAESFLDRYASATLQDLKLEVSDSAREYVKQFYSEDPKLKSLRERAAEGEKRLAEKADELAKMSKKDRKQVGAIVKNFAVDNFGDYISEFDALGTRAGLLSSKGREVSDSIVVNNFLKKFDVDKAREGIAKEYYDRKDSWINKDPNSDNYYDRDTFKNLIEPYYISFDPEYDTYQIYWDDGGTYGWHTFIDEGSISDMRVRRRSLEG